MGGSCGAGRAPPSTPQAPSVGEAGIPKVTSRCSGLSSAFRLEYHGCRGFCTPNLLVGEGGLPSGCRSSGSSLPMLGEDHHWPDKSPLGLWGLPDGLHGARPSGLLDGDFGGEAARELARLRGLRGLQLLELVPDFKLRSPPDLELPSEVGRAALRALRLVLSGDVPPDRLPVLCVGLCGTTLAGPTRCPF